MRWFFIAVAIVVFGLPIYVGSAIVSLEGLAAAARAGESAGVLARTDLPRLRRSLVDQVVTVYLKQLDRDRPVKPLERLAASTYGASIADATIAKMLTQENLAGLLSGGTINVGGDQVLNIPSLRSIDGLKGFDALKRISFVKPVEFLVRLGEAERDGAISIHFEGNGWKLSGILLPDAALQILSQSVVRNGRSG